jgi:hypothetical protein
MNRECVNIAGGIYPLTGDVVSTAGNQRVTVAGLQNIPIVSSTPGIATNLQYNVNKNQWTPTPIACISVDGVVVSYDYEIAVDAPLPVSVS